LKILHISSVFLSIILFSITFIVTVSAETLQDEVLNIDKSNLVENDLHVSFYNNLLPSYDIFVNSDEKYTLNQAHSWKRDEASRYNLIAYSLDGNDEIPISRQPRGEFTVDIPMDSSHSIIFYAQIQYPLAVEGATNFEFTPKSPTGDDWFDFGSDISVSVPYVTELQEGKTRQLLKTFSIDKTQISSINENESEVFDTPEIHISNLHTVDFSTTLQHKINVISEFGTVSNNTWYDAGSTAIISVNMPNEFFVQHVIDEWKEVDEVLSGNSAQIYVDSPKDLVITWRSNYSQLLILVLIPLIIGSILFIKKRNKKTTIDDSLELSSPEDTLIEKQPTNNNKQYDIDAIILEKATKELDSMRDSDLITIPRHSKIKEQLENLYKK